MKGILHWANIIVLISSIAIALIAVAVAWNISSKDNPEVALAIALAMIGVPIISLRSLKLGAMKGLHKVVLGQMPDALFAPIIIISLTTLAYFFFSDGFNVYWVLGIKIAASITTFIIGTRWLLKSLPKEVHQVASKYQSKKWFVDALPFMFLGTSQLLNSRIDVIMLGGIEGVAAVGIYAVLSNITKLTLLIHTAANNVLGPTVATLYSEGKIRQLEKLIQKSMLLVFLVSLLIGGIIILLDDFVLKIYGNEFLPGRTALSILILGQVFSSFTGAVGLVLNMTGNQNYTAFAVGMSAILNIILNAILIPMWGINGAATATTTSLIIVNIVKVIFVKRQLGISLYSLGNR